MSDEKQKITRIYEDIHNCIGSLMYTNSMTIRVLNEHDISYVSELPLEIERYFKELEKYNNDKYQSFIEYIDNRINQCEELCKKLKLLHNEILGYIIDLENITYKLETYYTNSIYLLDSTYQFNADYFKKLKTHYLNNQLMTLRNCY